MFHVTCLAYHILAETKESNVFLKLSLILQAVCSIDCSFGISLTSSFAKSSTAPRTMSILDLHIAYAGRLCDLFGLAWFKKCGLLAIPLSVEVASWTGWLGRLKRADKLNRKEASNAFSLAGGWTILNRFLPKFPVLILEDLLRQFQKVPIITDNRLFVDWRESFKMKRGYCLWINCLLLLLP